MLNRVGPGRSLRTSLWLWIAVLAVTMTASAAWADVTLVRQGKPTAKIYLSGQIAQEELTSAQLRKLSAVEKEQRAQITARARLIHDLNHHIQAMTGTALEVVVTDDPAAVKGPAVVFGDLATRMGATARDKTILGEAFRLIVRKDQVLLGGESEVAASHAMYHLLRSLGCDWVMPGPEGEVIPTRETLTIRDMDVALKPAFEVRAPWYSGGRNVVNQEEVLQFEEWKRRQGQSHGRPNHPEFLQGGHFWNLLLRRYKDRLTEDPTMRALVRQPDGSFVRGWAQLEPTHPGVVDITVEWIESQFKENGWPDDHAVTYSIGPNDGGGYSESPEALAMGSGRIDPITGDRDQTDVLMHYANQVLERLTPKYPNLKLGFLIYSVHADYPMRYKPHKNFVGQFADITYSRFHSTLDHKSYTRNYYRGIVEQWAQLSREQGNPLWYYGYNWNLAENLLPYTKVLIYGEELPWYHQMGVRGHNVESDKAWANLGPHMYLLARMGWDTTLDWREVLREYCQKAFGEAAAKPMEQYYLLLAKTQQETSHEAGSLHAMHLVLDRAFLSQARELIASAAAAAKTERDKKMVDYFSEPLTMLGMYHDYRDAIARYDFVEGKKQLDMMRDHWQRYHDMNSNLVSRYGFRYYDKWLAGPFIDTAVKYSNEPYSVVYKFPDALPTVLDPTNSGALMGLYEPSISDQTRLKTQTFGSTWDAQGLGPYRAGGVWYRVRFPVDKALEGQPIGLMIGAVEDTAHVWINGQYVGMGRGFIRPFLFDLTGHIKYGQENMVALQVIRRSKLNEAGLGGLLYPSFVFTGPQLENKAPAVEPMRRVLPGGGEGELEQ